MKLTRLEIFTLINCVWDCEKLLATDADKRERLDSSVIADLEESLPKLRKKLVEAFREADD